nr:MAG TPA: hypothetical protein [Inoviridae sp.]
MEISKKKYITASTALYYKHSSCSSAAEIYLYYI